jgi:hypothetical protein
MPSSKAAPRRERHLSRCRAAVLVPEEPTGRGGSRSARGGDRCLAFVYPDPREPFSERCARRPAMSTRVTDEQVLTWARKLRRLSELARVRQARPEVAGEAHAARRHDRAFGAPGDAATLAETWWSSPRGQRTSYRTNWCSRTARFCCCYTGIAAGVERPVPPADYRAAWAFGAKYEPETKGARRPRHLPSTRARSRRSMEEAKPRCARPGRLLSRAKSAPGRYQALGSWSRRDSSVGRAYD